MRRRAVSLLVVVVLASSVACDANAAPSPPLSRGPITVWVTILPAEWSFATSIFDAWNKLHKNQRVTVVPVPIRQNLDQTYSTTEEEIVDAVRGRRAPCLVFNVAPVVVAALKELDALVAVDKLPGGRAYIQDRSGDLAKIYESPSYWQVPWKMNPVLVFFNKDMFERAGLDPSGASLTSYDGFIETARVLKRMYGVALEPPSSVEFYQPWFDFYPLWIAATGKQLVENGAAAFNTDVGQAVVEFWRQLYAEGLARVNEGGDDPFGSGSVPITISGPWAIPSFDEKLEGKWGAVPVPTPDGRPANEVQTFRDAKNIGIFQGCKHLGTAWEVVKFATSVEQDARLLQETWQVPIRQNLLTYKEVSNLAANPARRLIFEQAQRTVEGPAGPNAIEIWQVFRDHYLEAVIDRDMTPKAALDEAASIIDS